MRLLLEQPRRVPGAPSDADTDAAGHTQPSTGSHFPDHSPGQLAVDSREWSPLSELDPSRSQFRQHREPESDRRSSPCRGAYPAKGHTERLHTILLYPDVGHV